MRAVEVTVHGRVQGVSFRAYAAHEAVRLEVAGWVRNDPSGTVSAHIEGDDVAVAAMLDWLHIGSPAADIDVVEVREVEAQDAASFEVRY